MKYKINELAKILDVSTNTVRRYEDTGYFASERDEESGYRYYNEESVLKVINAKFLRRYGFTHEELCAMQNMDITDTVKAYESQLDKIDKEIEYKKYLRHRIKDDIVLMKKMQTEEFFRMSNPEFLYITYKDNETIQKEKDRLTSLRHFVYDIPEVQRVFVVSRDTLEGKCIQIKSGWAVKSVCVDRDEVLNMPCVEAYESKPSVMGTVKVPVGKEYFEDLFRKNNEEIREKLLGRHLRYLEDNSLEIDGDAIFVVISYAREEGQDILYLWGSIPVKNK